MRGAVLLLLFITTIAIMGAPFLSDTIENVDEDREQSMYAVRVLNATEITVGQAVKIYTIINNIETWVLYNISCWFLVKPYTGIDIVDMLNTSQVTTKYVSEGEDFVNISVFIKKVDMKTRFIHWVVLRFKKNGTYDIISYNTSKVAMIHGTRVKGELIEEFNMTVNNASITVKNRPKPYPPEGTKNAYTAIIFVTLILPILIISLSNKIARRRE